MADIFQNILQMSIYGSIAIVVVLILRKCFNRLPKRVTCLFWLIPGIRLICPLNFDTIFSVMNITKLSDDADNTINKVADAVLPARNPGAAPKPVNNAAGAVTSNGFSNAFSDPHTIIAFIWLAGVIVIMTYLTVKTVRMISILKTARLAPGGKYYTSDIVDTSFVLGLIKPRIYMQSGLTKQEEAYILQHERMHIKKMDHITRIIGVLMVCVYWFNPFIWVGFGRLCADLEMRCDEAVIDRMGAGIKKEYCRSMVKHATERGTDNRGIYAAFSGDNYNGKEIRMRIENIKGYKKVSRIVAGVVIVFALGTTIALSSRAQNRSEKDSSTDADTEETVAVNEQASATETMVAADQDEDKEGAPVSVPGNILLDMTEEESLENYGKENFEIPDDVVYSDSGRPYSKTYDYRNTPILKKLAGIFEKEGFEIMDPDTEFLDKEGNLCTGRELYTLNAFKEDERGVMCFNVYMVSEEYARDSFDEVYMNDGGIWSSNPYGEAEDFNPDDIESNWYVVRIYDPETSVMMDMSGNYVYDWMSLGMFD